MVSHLDPLFPGRILVPQNAFWAQIRILGPEMPLGPENAFWGHFAPWPQMLMKPMVSASDFTLFGPKKRNFALFRILGPRNAK